MNEIYQCSVLTDTLGSAIAAVAQMKQEYSYTLVCNLFRQTRFSFE